MTGERDAMPAYLATTTLSRSATEAASPALLVVSIATLGSATTGSYLVAALTVSAAVGGPIVGALIDRARSPRGAFAVATIVMASGLAAVALLIGSVPLPVVMALAVAAGLGFPALTGAWSAQLPRLVTPARLTKAYASDAATYSIAAVIAPPLATALIAVSSTAPLWVPVILLIASMSLLRAVPLRPRPRDLTMTPLRESLVAGMGVIVRSRGLRRTVIITTVGFAGQASVFVAAPILAQSVGRSLAFTGVILGMFAVGGVSTALWFARRPVQRPDRTIIVNTGLSAIALVAIGWAPTPLLLALAAFAMGATEPPLVSAMFQVRARESPSAVQAQVFTTSASLRMTAFAIATAICGWLLGVGIAAVIAFGVLLHVVSLVLGLALGPAVPRREHWLRRS